MREGADEEDRPTDRPTGRRKKEGKKKRGGREGGKNVAERERVGVGAPSK